MSNLAGMQLVGGPFGVWTATMQVMPGGVLDASFGRYFVGIRVLNAGTTAWPVTHVRLSKRSRQQLVNAGIVIDDNWSAGDGLAFDQQVLGDAVVLPTLAANAHRTVFIKMDASAAHPGVHDFEIVLFDPTAPNTVLRARAPLRVARTVFDGHSFSFNTVADKGTLTTSLATAAFDVEALRRAMAKARLMFPPGSPSGGSAASQLDRVRARLSAFICGEEQDICSIFSEIDAFCAVPPPSNPPGSIPGLDGCAIFGDQGVTLADRVTVEAGNVDSDQHVQLGVEDVLEGNVFAGGNIVLADRAIVRGRASAGGTVTVPPSADVLGPISEHAPHTALTIPTRTVTPGTTNITLTSGSRALNPGAFGVVTTTGNVTLSFVAGTYHFRRLVLGPDVTLALNVSAGPIEIRVLEVLSFGDRATFNVTGPSQGRIQIYSDQADEVRIGTDIPTFTGTLLAPKGTVHMFSRSNVAGALWGKNVSVEPDCSVTLVPPPSMGTSWLGTGASGLELLAYPTALDYTLEYRDAYLGQTGPLAFDGLNWKSLVGNVNLMFNLVLGGLLPASMAATAAEIIVGKVKKSVLNATASQPSPPSPTHAGSVDAATISVLGNRALGSPPYALLDAQTGEANARPEVALDGRITFPGTFLKNTEINTIIANATSDPAGLQVYKSGAATGVTRGLLSALIPVFKRTDPTGSLHFKNQLSIIPDPAFPCADNQVAGSGDSGALWIHVNTGKVIALGHATGTSGSAVASRIEDVVNALKIQFA
jgi:hypothetical protein